MYPDENQINQGQYMTFRYSKTNPRLSNYYTTLHTFRLFKVLAPIAIRDNDNKVVSGSGVQNQIWLSPKFSKSKNIKELLKARSPEQPSFLNSDTSSIFFKVKSQYKTHNSELLAIIEVFKFWQHCVNGCKYEFFIFINYNNFYQFINTKNLNSC